MRRTVFGRSVASFRNTTFVPAAADAASVKLFTTERAAVVIDKCRQLHGGYGHMLEHSVARLYADTRVSRIHGGTSEVMRSVIAKSMGL